MLVQTETIKIAECPGSLKDKKIPFSFSSVLKVSKFRKQFMVSSILPQNERKKNQLEVHTKVLLGWIFFSIAFEIYWPLRTHNYLLLEPSNLSYYRDDGSGGQGEVYNRNNRNCTTKLIWILNRKLFSERFRWFLTRTADTRWLNP